MHGLIETHNMNNLAYPLSLRYVALFFVSYQTLHAHESYTYRPAFLMCDYEIVWSGRSRHCSPKIY